MPIVALFRDVESSYATWVRITHVMQWMDGGFAVSYEDSLCCGCDTPVSKFECAMRRRGLETRLLDVMSNIGMSLQPIF
jgi:hypothetical protein